MHARARDIIGGMLIGMILTVLCTAGTWVASGTLKARTRLLARGRPPGDQIAAPEHTVQVTHTVFPGILYENAFSDVAVMYYNSSVAPDPGDTAWPLAMSAATPDSDPKPVEDTKWERLVDEFETSYRVMIVIEHGWPFRVTRGYRTLEISESGTAPLRDRHSLRLTQQSSSAFSGYVGTEVLPAGFLWSTLTFAASWLVCVTALRLGRGWIRSRRGQCAACGYALSRDQPQCPECGAGRAP
ncbi:hypothetical protein PHYC_02303 [Phycisphaerales bacterium]|nr:hypothetical protein PHYC_02303 [Phycisphaerales bacterium]